MLPWESDLLTFAIFLAIVFLGYGGILVLLKRIDKRKAGTSKSIKLLRTILRFIVIFIIVIFIFRIFDIPSSLLISLSSISGIILGFASTEIVTRIIGGIYLIIARPFTVDNLVQINNIEGLVIEINLNHTLIKQFDNSIMLISNKNILDSQILNYTMNIQKELSTNESILEEEALFDDSSSKKSVKSRKKKNKLVGNLADFISEKMITQYVFELEIEFDKDPKNVLTQIDEVCEKFANVYYRKPRFKIVRFGFRAGIRFWVHARKPQTIMDNQNDFVYAIAAKIYSKKEGN